MDLFIQIAIKRDDERGLIHCEFTALGIPAAPISVGDLMLNRAAQFVNALLHVIQPGRSGTPLWTAHRTRGQGLPIAIIGRALMKGPHHRPQP